MGLPVTEAMAMGFPRHQCPLPLPPSYPLTPSIRGMPVTEAMAMGVPAIVTGWCGTADIVTPDVGWLVNYTLAPVRNGRGKRGGEERAGGGRYFRPADRCGAAGEVHSGPGD